MRDFRKKKTDWGKVANWYDEHLKESDNYHSQVILPNLMRLVDLRSGDSLVELGCGQGFFIEHFFKLSPNIAGVDLGPELIAIAKRNNPKINYLVASADDAHIFPEDKFDVVTVVLALQNMKNLHAVTANIARLLKPKGRAYIVLNHPAFRIPKQSDWQFDTRNFEQHRLVKRYMSELEIPIDMNPGNKKQKEHTVSFHRPLQTYSKAFNKNGLAITKIEEWISHKKSEMGKRALAEDRARKEFPMFMCLELKKVA